MLMGPAGLIALMKSYFSFLEYFSECYSIQYEQSDTSSMKMLRKLSLKLSILYMQIGRTINGSSIL